MSDAGAAIVDLFRIPNRFLRSVQLERDFVDEAALENYILTPSMAEAFARVADGLRIASGRRAWRVTGDYGVGKSSFALVLAQLLSGRRGTALDRVAAALGWTARFANGAPKLWPILVTGSRGSLVPALARGVGEALACQASLAKRKSRAVESLRLRAEDVAANGGPGDLEALIGQVRELAGSDGAGVLLIIDELGKFLEHAAQHPDREDVFVLQRLAELAARSGGQPFVFLGLLHQGFQAYAERLPAVAKHEWDKVAGRFEEIVFDQPLAHTAALVAGALDVQTKRLPTAVRDAARAAATATSATGWLGGGTTGAATLDAARLYPLHPTLLPVLVRFFARFGQHERSLFGFLLSSEPFGLQAFASRKPGAEVWYGLAEFYDYVRASFGHRLAGASYRSHWVRIAETIDGITEASALEMELLKAVAILNLVDADDLLPTTAALVAAFSHLPGEKVQAALAQLRDRGFLFQRGLAGALRLWPNSSVSLDAALDKAVRALGPVETVAGAIEPFLDKEPVLARRHYVEKGTLRYFELRYAAAAALKDSLKKAPEGDGAIVIALADTEQERELALKGAGDAPYNERKDVIVGITQPLLGLAPELQDLRCWQWVADNTPQLADDAYAAAEVARQLTSARRALATRLEELLGLRSGVATDVCWYRAGETVRSPKRGGLTALLSEVCDDLYPKAPKISNELLNRNTLSSAAAGARMRLIEGLFNAPDDPLLGIDPVKAPPEKSMYLSVIRKGGIHVQVDDRYRIVEPTKNDPLRLRPAFDRIIDMIEDARGDRVSALTILEGLRVSPWGVRAGVAPLLLAIILRTRSHELAVYEHGTFLHRFGPTDFLRLTKAPATFEVQHCRIAGVRSEVFSELAQAFSKPSEGRAPDILDVVRPLCQFAAQLPDYTRRCTSLSREALGVRDALLSAREPATMLFTDLPKACGVEAFSPDEESDGERVRRFVSALHVAVGELRGAYPELLARIIAQVAQASGSEAATFDRARLASRAARVSLAAREPRLRTFALRLRDPGLSDEAWAEALASFVVAKPPARWAPGDETRFGEEIGALAELFHKVEGTAFLGEGGTPVAEALRLNLTRGDGEDRMRVIEPRPDDRDLAAEAELIRGRLPQDRLMRLQLLAHLMWADLDAAAQPEAVAQHAERRRK
ncbi:MAG: hypothetical protein ACEQR8_00055 [Cypionkella sp.]